jgi:hypothetical protein
MDIWENLHVGVNLHDETEEEDDERDISGDTISHPIVYDVVQGSHYTQENLIQLNGILSKNPTWSLTQISNEMVRCFHSVRLDSASIQAYITALGWKNGYYFCPSNTVNHTNVCTLKITCRTENTGFVTPDSIQYHHHQQQTNHIL